ncbi:MAG: response regulator [Pedosphaera parvula]|nr:response regulator [Pedosphaera parvula]
MESTGTLASGIAHDLNNVLAPIVMCLSMLRDTTTDGELIELIDTMQTAARRGADIVRQVLTFARGLGGDRVEIQPKHVIQETARIAHETFPRSIDVTCDFGRELQTFLGDPTQIQQVLMNLCVNARDAMPNGGKLHIRADNTSRVPSDALPAPKERDLGIVVISVTDTGSGMPPEVKDRIFDPFFTTKPIGKGTGLGLAVSIGIIERHGGCMHVESAPDAGTTFRVFLPAATGGPTAGSSARIDETLPHGRGETILVVDDEPSVRTIISGMLERSGYLPIVARDGAEALDRLNDLGDAVRMLITDLMMPGMDGLELIRSVRTTWPGLPIIAMSGLGEDDIRATAEDAGADRVLSKPFTNHTLLRAASDTMNPTTSPRAQSGD